MDHVEHFMFSKGHILAENLSTNFFQILDWPKMFTMPKNLTFFLIINSEILSFRVIQYLLLCRLREQLQYFGWNKTAFQRLWRDWRYTFCCCWFLIWKGKPLMFFLLVKVFMMTLQLDRCHLFCSNLNMKKSNSQVSNSAQQGHQPRNKEEEQSLHHDAANRIKIQDFSFCSFLDLNIPGASVSLLIIWEWRYFLTY